MTYNTNSFCTQYAYKQYEITVLTYNVHIKSARSYKQFQDESFGILYKPCLDDGVYQLLSPYRLQSS